MKVLTALAFGVMASAQSGHWEGKIQIPGHEVLVAVDLAKDRAGSWIGAMSVLQSTSVDVPLAEIRIQGPEVRFKANLPELASFAGALAADGNSISGSVNNSLGDAPFALSRAGEPKVNLPAPSSALSKDFAGTWQGSIEIQGQELRVLVKLGAAPDGRAVATLVSVDQGNLEIPATTVIIAEKRLELEVRALSGTYQGTLEANGRIAGEWSQGPIRSPLVLKRVAAEEAKQ